MLQIIRFAARSTEVFAGMTSAHFLRKRSIADGLIGAGTIGSRRDHGVLFRKRASKSEGPLLSVMTRRTCPGVDNPALIVEFLALLEPGSHGEYLPT